MNFICKNPKCGKLVYLNDKICPHCGIKNPSKKYTNDGEIPIILIIIIILLSTGIILFLIRTMVGHFDLFEFFGLSHLEHSKTCYFAALHYVIALKH